jgi:hypothetical protein
MELWEKHRAYIPRRFVWSKWSSSSVSITFGLGRTSGPEFCQVVAELGDGFGPEPGAVIVNSSGLMPQKQRMFRSA